MPRSTLLGRFAAGPRLSRLFLLEETDHSKTCLTAAGLQVRLIAARVFPFLLLTAHVRHRPVGVYLLRVSRGRSSHRFSVGAAG